MFRLWAKLYTNNRLINDVTIEDDSKDSRTQKVFHSLEKVCYAFDLSKPIWLESNINEFKRRNKTRFNSDSFVDEIDFDFLEIHIIEED